MAVHGRFRQPCPVCGAAVQRIVYAENECNYCPRCQTGGRLLAHWALARLLKDDRPGSIAELEEGPARPAGIEWAPPAPLSRPGGARRGAAAPRDKGDPPAL